MLFSVIFAYGEFYAQVRDMSFGRGMRFARWKLQGEYNITVSIIREANWRTISLRAQRVISRRAKRGISPKNARVQVYTKTPGNIFFVLPSQKIRQVKPCRIFLCIAKAMVYHHALACVSSF